MSSSKPMVSIVILLVFNFIFLAGCSPATPSRSEFKGEVLTEVPDVPGANEQYPLLKLPQKTPADTESSNE